MKRIIGYLVLFAVYVLAAAIGIISYYFLQRVMNFVLALLIADIAATVFVFIFSLIFKNASVYDPYWSVQPIVILVAYAIITSPSAANLLPLIAVLIWGVRLTANWAYTFRGLSYQDWRYTMLAQKTGRWYIFVNFLGIHLVPTLVVYGCVLPAVFTYMATPAPTFNAGSIIFFCVSIAAVVLQGASDIQMHIFRKNHSGGFISNGLWKYSRHPNYLGEIIMWWGIALAAVCIMPTRWWLMGGALANTLMFLFISIPLADGHQSRKDGFIRYKENTRMLLPIYKHQSDE